VAGEVLEQRRLRRRDIELAQLDLRRGPGQVECSLRGVRIVVAVGELEGARARRGDERRKGHRGRLARLEPHTRAEGEDRIEHGTRGPRQGTVGLEGHGVTR
jgi:hypothetical protein